MNILHPEPPEGGKEGIAEICELLKAHGTIVDVQIGEKPGIVILVKQCHGTPFDIPKILMDSAYAELFLKHQDALYDLLETLRRFGSTDPSQNRLHYLLEGMPRPDIHSPQSKQLLENIALLDTQRRSGHPEALQVIYKEMTKNPASIKFLMGSVRFAAQQLGTFNHGMLVSEPTIGRDQRVDALSHARQTMNAGKQSLRTLRAISASLEASRAEDHKVLHDHIATQTGQFADENTVTVVVIGGGHINKGAVNLPAPYPLEDYITGSTRIIVEPTGYDEIIAGQRRRSNEGNTSRISTRVVEFLKTIFRLH